MSRAIETSAAALGLSAQTSVVRADLESLGWLERVAGPYDLVLCDPPYARIERVHVVLEALSGRHALTAEACVVVEHSRRDPPTLPPGFEEVRVYRYGDTSVLLAEHRALT